MPMPSFFGGRRRMRGASVPENLGVNPLQPTEQKPDIPTGEVRSRRSFMGGPSTLAVLGATLRQMDGGNELDEYLSGQQDQQYRRDMFGMRTRAQKQEEGDAERTRQERLAAVGALPENLRPFGSLAVEPYLESLSRGPSESYGDLERIDGRLGQRNAITGLYDWAPQVPGSAGPAVPSGYERTPDGRGLQPIQGGPADVRASAEGRAQAQRLESSERQLGNGISVLNEVLGLSADDFNPDSMAPSNGGQVNNNTSGVFANATRNMGINQGAIDLQEALQPVRAITAFENLAEMRRNSATGGALGGIAVRELDLLASTLRSLETNQNPQQLRRNLIEVRRQFLVTRRAIADARAELQAMEQGGQPAQGGGQNVPVIELEAE
jgi:hypothetical protein